MQDLDLPCAQSRLALTKILHQCVSLITLSTIALFDVHKIFRQKTLHRTHVRLGDKACLITAQK